MKVLGLFSLFFFLMAWTGFFEQAYATKGEMPRTYRSAYFLGRGDTGIAIADEEEAIFYNPAGLAVGKGIFKKLILLSPMVEFSSHVKDLGRQLGAEKSAPVDTLRQHIGRPQHVGLNQFTGILLRRAALGAFVSGSTDMMVAKSPDHGGLEIVSVGAQETAGLTFTLSESFLKQRMFLGANIKYVQRAEGYVEASIADQEKIQTIDAADILKEGTGTGVDLGFMWKWSHRTQPSLGIAIQNAGDTPISPKDSDKKVSSIKQQVNLGFAVSPGTKTSKFRILFDYYDVLSAVEDNALKKIHLGTELTVGGIVGFTGGLNQGYPTGGLYVDTRVFRLDVGGYAEEVGDRVGTRPDQRYFFKMTLGF